MIRGFSRIVGCLNRFFTFCYSINPALVGVTMDLDVVYVESAAHEKGTLKRPGGGAVRGILETAIGRAWLAQLNAEERTRFLARARRERPEESARCLEGTHESVASYIKRGFAINLGDESADR
jgi:DNA-binding IclR family transcriptional regulator